MYLTESWSLIRARIADSRSPNHFLVQWLADSLEFPSTESFIIITTHQEHPDCKTESYYSIAVLWWCIQIIPHLKFDGCSYLMRGTKDANTSMCHQWHIPGGGIYLETVLN